MMREKRVKRQPIQAAVLTKEDKKAFNRELLTLAVPLALQNLLVALVGASDALMLGRLNQASIAAVSLANQVSFVMSLFTGSVIGAIGVLVANISGVLSRVSGMFTRRGFNIDSLTVGETEAAGLSRITVAFRGDEDIRERIVTQLEKLHDVKEVEVLDQHETVIRELLLLKKIGEFPAEVAADAALRKPNKLTDYIISLVKTFHAYYNAVKVNNPDDPELTNQRLGLVTATKITLRNVLALIGVSAPESM